MSTAADTPTVITAVSMLPELDNLALLTDEQILALLDRAGRWPPRSPRLAPR
ncbi:hypothetical protein [Enemella dayhoffiae]|uniref:hypothetical protein n=1 Tax=Enemella dayhoffiae TaxID=2016507 RepID=UPI0015953BC1|nr:hypothetical protein [Enemella dayhoffiae]